MDLYTEYIKVTLKKQHKKAYSKKKKHLFKKITKIW